MRRPLVAGNWKMNTISAEALELAREVAAGAATAAANADLLVCPPAPWLVPVRDTLGGSNVLLGAQDACYEKSGAFTGEISVAMLADAGCSHVILGHSERRHIMGETNETVCRKVKAVLEGGLVPILCVGEQLEEREAGQTETVLDGQMAGSLAGLTAEDLSSLVIAYEPVWAIGTGKTASPEQAQAVHAHLRKWLAGQYTQELADQLRILYGGSVKPDNAAELLGQPDIDGALVGGASLKADSFLAIAAAAPAAG